MYTLHNQRTASNFVAVFVLQCDVGNEPPSSLNLIIEYVWHMLGAMRRSELMGFLSTVAVQEDQVQSTRAFPVAQFILLIGMAPFLEVSDAPSHCLSVPSLTLVRRCS